MYMCIYIYPCRVNIRKDMNIQFGCRYAVTAAPLGPI